MCWGRNAEGQFGDDTTLTWLGPRSVAGLSGIVDIGAGDTHTCAVTVDQRTWCWGANDQGQLGTGNTTASARPVPVVDYGDKFLTVDAGGSFTCGVVEGGEARCWGDGSFGRLGNAFTSNTSSPSQVVGVP